MEKQTDWWSERNAKCIDAIAVGLLGWFNACCGWWLNNKRAQTRSVITWRCIIFEFFSPHSIILLFDTDICFYSEYASISIRSSRSEYSANILNEQIFYICVCLIYRYIFHSSWPESFAAAGLHIEFTIKMSKDSFWHCSDDDAYIFLLYILLNGIFQESNICTEFFRYSIHLCTSCESRRCSAK